MQDKVFEISEKEAEIILWADKAPAGIWTFALAGSELRAYYRVQLKYGSIARLSETRYVYSPTFNVPELA